MPEVTLSFRTRLGLISAAPLLLAACSGGSDGGNAPAPMPSPANRAPAFTSSPTASVDENATGTLYTIAVSDPDGDTLSVSVVPGGDEAAFNIDTDARTISAATPLDFEAPADANGDNVYNITLEARDSGGLTARLDLAITVNDVVEGMTVARVGTGFTQPLYLAGLPGTTQVVVLEKGGRIRVLDPATGAIDAVDFLDVSGETSAAGEGGLLGLAFSPDFASDRTFYINMTNNSGDTEIRRYRMFSGSMTQADPATADVILTFAQPESNHNGGWIGFAQDGLLFVPTGAEATLTATRRTPTRCLARSCALMCGEMISQRMMRAIIPYRPVMPLPEHPGVPRFLRLACATLSGAASMKSLATSSLAMWGRTLSRKLTVCG